MNAAPESAEDVLRFWFGEPGGHPLANAGKWFTRDAGFDAACAGFVPLIERAGRGELEGWLAEPRSALAYVVLLDQLPRNAFRGTARAFAYDARALAASLDGQARGLDARLAHVERQFFYLPMMHAEDRDVQRRAVAAFEALAASAPEDLAGALRAGAEYARRHRDIVERFGRFPHRNATLGRASTSEEVEFLKQPGSSF